MPLVAPASAITWESKREFVYVPREGREHFYTTLKPAQQKALARALKFLTDGNNLMNWFVREMGGWEVLPDTLGAMLPGAWAAEEKAIFEAAHAGDTFKVNQLGAAYVTSIIKSLRGAWQAHQQQAAQVAEGKQ